jgi:uncharacterized membrane protein YccF (DUF307 family)
MKLLGNFLWVILGGGIIIALEYFISGLILCLTIVGIPFGVQAFRLAGLALWPFGSHLEYGERQAGCLATVMNILWIVLGGVWIALTHVVFALIMAITIIGIPFARQHMKLAGFAFSPFGLSIRSDA